MSIELKLKLSELEYKLQGLQQLGMCKLSPKMSYRTTKIVEMIGKELETYGKARMGIIDKLCDKDEKGEYKKLIKENIDPITKKVTKTEVYDLDETEFIKQNNEILSEEITLDFQPLVLNDSIVIEPAYFNAIECFLDPEYLKSIQE